MMFKKLRISFSSPFTEIPTADQLFGQLVWAVSDIRGEAAAGALVKRFRDNPPFLISEAIPEGFLPLAVYPPSDNQDKSQESRHKAKRNKKYRWIRIDSFASVQKDPRLIHEVDFESAMPDFKSITETHVQINRIKGTAEDGILYTERYIDYRAPLVSYIKINDANFWVDFQIDELLEYLSIIGLGGNRNVGRGSCTIILTDLAEKENEIFSFKASSFATLSKCSGMDLLEGSIAYKIVGHAGIVGRASTSLFNKKPVLFFDVGSTFSSGTGEMISDIHPDKNISYYGYSFPLYLKIED